VAPFVALCRDGDALYARFVVHYCFFFSTGKLAGEKWDLQFQRKIQDERNRFNDFGKFECPGITAHHRSGC
jgi:hypothetical protein